MTFVNLNLVKLPIDSELTDNQLQNIVGGDSGGSIPADIAQLIKDILEWNRKHPNHPLPYQPGFGPAD